ncbi:MAG: exodeoxyribonuclease VII small subunit [Candidatus Izemoplasmatales bacterium]|jgi:exodeoxyribonuclease VII small subunit|nr:exodeoxyribonuclease VII small subunit [Candidatus Izemoplasmatales bacterium]MDY0010123.1 exodeoxyribonuclease VII small subunit [Candidatus Izemoplasmatales bacterium]
MNKLSFEENLEKLEALVKKLESGENSLDEAVKLYQEGIALAKICHEELKNAEEVIVKLMDSDNLVDFNKE